MTNEARETFYTQYISFSHSLRERERERERDEDRQVSDTQTALVMDEEALAWPGALMLNDGSVNLAQLP